MDAKKSRIRIKPAKLREDQRRWDQEKDPYWKHQQTVARPGASRTGGTFRGGSMEPSSFILDVLVNVGSGFLKDEVDAFKSRLQCLDRFMRMTSTHIDTKPSPRKQHVDLQALVHYYVSTPALEDVPLLAAGPHGAAQVARIKASYAYIWDLLRYFDRYRQVGGSPSGFAWKIAMGELGDIKARAVQPGNAACVPYETLERVAVPKHFR
jgi:hypothetical protein